MAAIANETARADELRDLEVFTGPDPEKAERAFDRLSLRVDLFLHKFLSSSVQDHEERKDVIATVLEKLYMRRSEFQVQSVGAWWSYVATTARRCAYDRSPQKHLELHEELPDRDLEVIGNLAELSYFRSQLYRAADELWLGIPHALPENQRRKRLLAAQLFYLNGSSWQEIGAIVGNGSVVVRSTIDAWLTDRSVLMDLAYSVLYIDNDSLAGIILRPDRPLTRRELDETNTVEGWSSAEFDVAVERYRNGLLKEKIVSRMDGRLTEDEVERTLERCLGLLPFERRVKDLQGSFATRRAPIDILADPNLWKRLAFQYAIVHELPQRQILERTEKAAGLAGYSLTAGVLSAWLSNGRLLEQLSSYVKEARK